MYKNKDIEESKKYIIRKNEIISNRLLMLFGAAVILVASLVYLMNVISYETTERIRAITFVCMFIFGAFLALTFIFLLYRYKNGVDESETTLNSKHLFGISLFLFIANLLIFFTYQKWIPFLTAFTISFTVITYIYYLYQREFFVFSVFSAIGCFLIYFGEGRSFPVYFSLMCKILLAIIAVFVLVASLTASRNKGVLFKLRVFDKKAKYFQLYILAAILAVSVALVVQTFFSINFLYIIIAVIAYFVIIGIYFTIKMIY